MCKGTTPALLAASMNFFFSFVLIEVDAGALDFALGRLRRLGVMFTHAKTFHPNQTLMGPEVLAITLPVRRFVSSRARGGGGSGRRENFGLGELFRDKRFVRSSNTSVIRATS
jgi:hypothetical protein